MAYPNLSDYRKVADREFKVEIKFVRGNKTSEMTAYLNTCDVQEATQQAAKEVAKHGKRVAHFSVKRMSC